jgi:hypothetical protein
MIVAQSDAITAGVKRQHELLRIVDDLLHVEITEKQARPIKH